jgi:hypothetical protein
MGLMSNLLRSKTVSSGAYDALEAKRYIRSAEERQKRSGVNAQKHLGLMESVIIKLVIISLFLS